MLRKVRRGDAKFGIECADHAAVPLFGNWRNAYLAVVLVFILEVAVFFVVSRYFS